MSEQQAAGHSHFVQAPIRPLDEDGVSVAILGTIAWLVASAVCWLQRDDLVARGDEWWLWVALSGAALGALGTAYCLHRRSGRRG